MKRLILSVALPLVLLVAAVAASPAAADGVGLPAHAIGKTECGQGYVKTWHPRQMLSSFATTFRNPELVRWSPDLHRWNGTSWQLYDGSRPWYRAFTSSHGYFQSQFTATAWQSEATNAPISFVPFYNLPRGYYAIKNYMRWDRLSGTHAEWSAYCSVN
jgi:hypothetical protein